MFSLFHHSNRTLNKRNLLLGQFVLLVQLFVRPSFHKVLIGNKDKVCPCNVHGRIGQAQHEASKLTHQILLVVLDFFFSIECAQNQIGEGIHFSRNLNPGCRDCLIALGRVNANLTVAGNQNGDRCLVLVDQLRIFLDIASLNIAGALAVNKGNAAVKGFFLTTGRRGE